MVALGISEFTFGFAFLYEQAHANWADLQAAPILPSLQQEADQGWDAHLPLVGAPYFYQFKLAEYLYRRNAKLIQDGTYDSPFYRFSLHHRENNLQHRRLKLHSQTQPNTYYVAPEMHSLDEFNTSFLNRSLSASSRLIPLSECQDLAPDDTEQHFITYQAGSPQWRFHSKPQIHATSYSGAEIANLYRKDRDKWGQVDVSFAKDVLEATVQASIKAFELEGEDRPAAIQAILNRARQVNARSEMLAAASQLLSVSFGLTMVIVGERPR